ncbi:MAG: hypothetical protein ACREEM_20705 [Blastocatellia bacterium]
MHGVEPTLVQIGRRQGNSLERDVCEVVDAEAFPSLPVLDRVFNRGAFATRTSSSAFFQKLMCLSARFYATIGGCPDETDPRTARFRLTFDLEPYDPENPAVSPVIRAPARCRHHQYAEKVHHGG